MTNDYRHYLTTVLEQFPADEEAAFDQRLWSHVHAALEAALAAAPQGEPVAEAWQYRTRPREANAPWSVWADIWKEAADVLRTASDDRWEYEVRPLYAAPPAPAAQPSNKEPSNG